jgi:hypothetical protein
VQNCSEEEDKKETMDVENFRENSSDENEDKKETMAVENSREIKVEGEDCLLIENSNDVCNRDYQVSFSKNIFKNMLTLTI